jgi:cytoskeletal protein RodZ
MTGPAIVLAASLVIVFVGALALDWLENRKDWKEWSEDHPEPPSRMDRLDHPDEWMP